MHKTTHTLFFYLVFYLTLFFFTITLILNFSTYDHQQYSYLARAFNDGSLALLDEPGGLGDVAVYKGQYFWPTGPFPAFALMPLAAFASLFGGMVYQGFVQYFLVIVCFMLWKKIAESVGYADEDQSIWALAFCFGSVYLGIALVPYSWYLAHSFAYVFTLLAVYLFMKKSSFFWIGACLGCVLLSRAPSAFGIIFFLFMLLSTQKKRLSISLFSLLIPFTISIFIYGIYNVARFGSVFEQGYTYQVLPQYLQVARSLGVFSPVHIPGNLYAHLLSMPNAVLIKTAGFVARFPYVRANPWGMSIFVTSPYLLLLFFIRRSSVYTLAVFSSVVMIFLTDALFFGNGFFQYGSRFSLDYLPYLFFLLMVLVRKQSQRLSTRMKVLLLGSTVLNLSLFLTSFIP